MKTKAERASINGIPLEKIAANGTNGHAEMHPLEKLLAGLSHEQRVEALGVMGEFTKAGKLTADVATCIVEDIRMRTTEKQPAPQARTGTAPSGTVRTRLRRCRERPRCQVRTVRPATNSAAATPSRVVRPPCAPR